jgi:lysophospholipase L1-like esterase
MAGRVLLLLATLLVSFGLAEAGLRLIGFDFPQFHERDDTVGLTLRPGAEGWYTEEGRAWVEVNSAGMRDVERTRAKPAGRLRVAVLGDSYTEAIQVDREKAYPALLEQHLARCRPGTEVLNFGVSGFGTAQQLLRLRAKVWDYAPDIVLLAFFPSNDVRDNSRTLDHAGLRPYFVPEGDRLALDDSFLQSKAYRALSNPAYEFLRTHSRVVMLATRARKALMAMRAPRSASPELGLDWHVFRPPDSPAWTEAWTVTERLLEAMHAEVAGHGAKFAITTVTDPAAVHPDLEVRRRYAAELEMPDLLYAERRLGEFAAKHGIAFLPLTPGMDRLAAGKALHGFGDNLGFGHWNEDGHRAAAQLMGEFLCGLRLQSENVHP